MAAAAQPACSHGVVRSCPLLSSPSIPRGNRGTCSSRGESSSPTLPFPPQRSIPAKSGERRSGDSRGNRG
uniref:Uncharacterized protein n=1 Tax=Oryza punctata TaxID=4537 RepID=A0A0E0L7G8_ORYPU